MNIGFDAKRIFYNRTGLGNYGRNLISYLHKFYPENKYFLFTPNKKNRLNFSLDDSIKIIEPQIQSILYNNFWRTKKILKNDVFKNLYLYHGLSNELPIGISKTKVKSVVSVHDLIFLKYPKLYKKIDRFIYYQKVKKACQETDKIISISEQTKNDIIEFLRTDENKIVTVYQGCDYSFYITYEKEQKDLVRKKYNLPQDFILNVGTIEERKNALLIVKSLHKLKIDIPLVIIGKEKKYSDLIKSFVEQNKLKKQINIISNIDFKDLPVVYQMAKLFIYPSVYEGFGIPIIEALNSNIPVICTDIPVFREVADNAAVYFENNNIESLSEKILFLLNSKDEQKKYIELGKQRAVLFSDENIAQNMIEVYKNV